MCIPKIANPAAGPTTLPSLQSASALLLGGAGGQQGILGRQLLRSTSTKSSAAKTASSLLSIAAPSPEVPQEIVTETPGLNPNVDPD